MKDMLSTGFFNYNQFSVRSVCGLIPDIINLISMVNADTLRAYVQHLQNYQARYALVDNHTEVANWIRGKFEDFGFTNTWMQEYPHNNSTQYNVIATIPGYLHPDIYIV